MKLITLILVALMFISSQSIFQFVAMGARIIPSAIRVGSNAAKVAGKVGKGLKTYNRFERARQHINNFRRR